MSGVALVTGAASGIGEAIARRFARDGISVALVDVSPHVARTAEAIAADSGSPARGFVADATDATAMRESVDAAQAEFGPVSILVNNAWSGSGEAALETTEQQWDDTLRGTLTSAFVCARAVLPRMVAAGAGVIVNVSSINAERFGGHDAYSAAKAGMMSLTRNLAARHGGDGIRVNAILVGSIVTPAWRERAAARPGIFDELVPFYPLGRLGTPDDVANAVAFLVSEDASWITGAALPVDGGHLVWNGDLARVAEPVTVGGSTDG